MSGILSRIVLVAFFCLGAVGASGFGETVEPLAWPFFLVGIGGTVVGGLLLRRDVRRRAAESGVGELSREGLAAELERIAREVASLDDAKDTIEGDDLTARIDELLTGPYFEIGNRNEGYARVLGPSAFAGIWEGFAVSERLLARAWSMATDGHLAEALPELPRAREQIVHAAEEARRDDREPPSS